MMEKKQAHVPSPGSQIPPPVKKDATRYTSGSKLFKLDNSNRMYYPIILPYLQRNVYKKYKACGCKSSNY